MRAEGKLLCLLSGWPWKRLLSVAVRLGTRKLSPGERRAMRALSPEVPRRRAEEPAVGVRRLLEEGTRKRLAPALPGSRVKEGVVDGVRVTLGFSRAGGESEARASARGVCNRLVPLFLALSVVCKRGVELGALGRAKLAAFTGGATGAAGAGRGDTAMLRA